MKNPRIGSSFESFLEAEGTRAEVEDLAVKRVLAWQLQAAMQKTGIKKVELAQRMHTSRAQVERLLDPSNNKVQLDTLQRAARAVGRKLKLELA
jgi:antitoxin HicB